ncbi:Mn2+/Fe2+ NRAMP family transporter [Lipingzhangella halophila]|uniref:Mn2+/Fe2+ NRAMP family transporter n=1 Tax=Lipingzhangella halophila TaxID=1783352 RepID=A0A7W7RMU7_9ACTN|nr:Nramp family divalent metal transporter [Lipingzhangella halophila]MBB4934923.1 Mn2+/Fe2+ NRAMP family transporter [Lipingzhangella halophila]
MHSSIDDPNEDDSNDVGTDAASGRDPSATSAPGSPEEGGSAGTGGTRRDTPSEAVPVRLEAPGTGFRQTWKAMGPGIAAAMTGIGSSHIIHAPTAGAQWGYTLLWIIPVAYLLKYCAFEFAHRYTVVRGESIIEAYQRVGRGYGQWPLWYLLFNSVANTFSTAGRALGTAAMIWAAFPFLPLPAWGILVLLACVAILWTGKYAALETVVKLCIIVFCVAVLVAFVLRMPSPDEYVANLVPALAPAGALVLVGAMFGYFPTTVEISPMQSNWAVAKGAGMARVRALERQGHRVELAPNYLRNNFKLFKRDMNISYVISGLTGLAFLIVGAVVLHPIGLVPEKSEMGATIARMYTDTFGQWVFPVIIAGGVAALFSTTLTYFDGQPRIFVECCVRLRTAWDTPKVRGWLYRGFQIVWIVAGSAIIIGLPEPVLVVQLASVLALLFSPVIYWLNIKAVRDNFTSPAEREFLPSRPMMVWAWLGLLGLVVICVWILSSADLTEI